jgi:hypothetical protein
MNAPYERFANPDHTAVEKAETKKESEQIPIQSSVNRL